ncbi:asialoglycoprotein receptor-like 1 [Xyrauchen texanus]|uniref:asialoglycoprotein receptor-like 1 n=1 Tax=Xyrauchen texanus TaxID=154827 RepID=UPI002242425F|nr:asialoglycoprotein receptor-like 1 [Xyrauchen texanus]XP_051965383.1 asialoglycoprotein receptor-like 1 [Xyrauchen texanus]
MESIAYDRFSGSEAEINHTGPKIFHAPGRQNRKMYIMYGILVLYLFILTLVVGIKISQVSQEIDDVTLSLKTIGASIEGAPKLQFENVHFSERTMPVQGLCENDWLFYKGSCYFVSTRAKTWQNAEDNCVQKKTHLVVVNDLDELEFLSSILKSPDSYWIGLIEKKEGQWSWVDGTDFATTEHLWDVGQPDNWDVRVNGEDCGQLHGRKRTDNRRMWNDADCTLFYPFICEGKPKSH